MRYFFSAFIIALLFVSSDLQAQQDFRLGPGVVIGDTTLLQELVLTDYSTLLGYCINISSELVFFQLREANEVTEFPKDEVRYLGLFVPLTKGGIRTDKFDYARRPAFTDATYNRTALPTKGKGQFRTINILYSIAEFKLSDEFQLGIGLLTPFGLLTTQRLRFKLADNINFGFSNQALYSNFDFDGSTLVGDLTANFTVGDENRFFNIGGGFFYNLSDELKPTHLNLAIGGRVGDNWHLYGEMSVVDDSFEVLIFPTINAAYTVRRHRWRFGVASVLTEFDGPLIPIPLIGYEYHW